MSWDTAFDSNSGSSGGKKVEFTSFPEGITKVRVVGDSPFVRWTHWMPQHKRSINCPGRGCPICALNKAAKEAGEKPLYGGGRRWCIWIINRENGKLEIMEQGKGFFEDLRDLRQDNFKEYGEMSNYDLKIRRRGTKQDDTSYRIDVDAVSPLSDSDKKLMEDIIDLNEYFKPHTIDQIKRVVAGEAWADVMKSDTATSDATSGAETEQSEEEYEIK